LIQITKRFGCCPTALSLPMGSVNFDLEERGRGGFGRVYKGTFRNRVVAVKELWQEGYDHSGEFRRAFCNEAIVWRFLKHPNCIPLYGVYRDGMKTYLVSPWMRQGNLTNYLSLNQNANRESLILDITRGLHYLHSLQPHVAHLDLKPDNILVSDEGRACLTDFGMATTFDTQAYMKPVQRNIGGTLPYMAPELLRDRTKQDIDKINKRACDIYALGCTIYVIYAGKSPFEGVHRDHIPAVVRRGDRPSFDGVNIPPDMRSFTKRLWVDKPLERLTSQQALDWMKIRAFQGVSCPSSELEWKWEVDTEQLGAGGPLYLDVEPDGDPMSSNLLLWPIRSLKQHFFG
ncbi:hypothetical protein SCLCIDRAFT_103079, partial [Scleroderma citrinum Foug A]